MLETRDHSLVLIGRTQLKTALIFGVTGQDGSYLVEFLLSAGYDVHGVRRRSSSFNTQRLEHLLENSDDEIGPLTLHYGDLSDSINVTNLVTLVQPDEIYNLAAQSHVALSFELPDYTADINAIGTLRILEAIRVAKLEHKTKFYQASTSELFGLVQQVPQTESTPFYPRSPYAVAKLYAYWITVNYRESYNMFACNGILFNHESPRRGETFVSRKITRGLSKIALGLDECLHLGNLDAKRDWGHAEDYVKMQWLMLQQDQPKDYVIATGKQHSVRDFVTMAANNLGITIEFQGSGLSERAVIIEADSKKAPRVHVGQTIIRINKKYYRPAEVETLLGDSSQAESELGWKPSISFEELCGEMVEEDFASALFTVQRSKMLNEKN